MKYLIICPVDLEWNAGASGDADTIKTVLLANLKSE